MSEVSSYTLFQVPLKIGRYDTIKNSIIRKAQQKNGGYICFSSSDTIAIANKDAKLLNILSNSSMTLIDGKITEKYLRLKGIREVDTISGYNLLTDLLNSELTHYFYGADEDTLDRLQQKIEKEFPRAKVYGYKSPPFYEKIDDLIQSELIKTDIIEIDSLKPDIVWLGISSPKQDFLMYHFQSMLNQSMMIGVGAVFLYMSGKIKKSPEWIKKIGMRWFYRMMREPFRLIPFVLPNLFYFLKLVVLDIFTLRYKR